jgi:hypothetical protein
VQRPAPPDFPDWLAPSGVAAVSAASAAISEALDVPISALPAPAKSRASVEQSPVTEIRDAPQALREPEPLLERDSGFAFEPDLAPAPTSWRDRAVFALVIIVLMLAGASGAAWTFREPLRRAVTQWQSR